jgi:hypothetical protein
MPIVRRFKFPGGVDTEIIETLPGFAVTQTGCTLIGSEGGDDREQADLRRVNINRIKQHASLMRIFNNSLKLLAKSKGGQKWNQN